MYLCTFLVYGASPKLKSHPQKRKSFSPQKKAFDA